MDTIDLRVAKTLMRLRLVERALHDPGPWSVEYAGARVPASRFIREDRVTFAAHFPPMCVVAPIEAVAVYCGDVLVHSIPLDEPLDEEGCQFYWDLSLHESVLTS